MNVDTEKVRVRTDLAVMAAMEMYNTERSLRNDVVQEMREKRRKELETETLHRRKWLRRVAYTRTKEEVDKMMEGWICRHHSHMLDVAVVLARALRMTCDKYVMLTYADAAMLRSYMTQEQRDAEDKNHAYEP